MNLRANNQRPSFLALYYRDPLDHEMIVMKFTWLTSTPVCEYEFSLHMNLFDHHWGMAYMYLNPTILQQGVKKHTKNM